MSGAVDKLDLGGILTELGTQVNRVKSQKTSKMRLLAKAARRFDPTNLSSGNTSRCVTIGLTTRLTYFFLGLRAQFF